MARIWTSLTPRWRFTHMAKQGAKAYGPGLTAQWRLDDGILALPHGWHIGLTVSKKHGKAVTRNRTKRRLRAALDAVLTKPRWASLAANQAICLVVIPKAQPDETGFDELTRHVETLLKRVDAAMKPPPAA